MLIQGFYTIHYQLPGPEPAYRPLGLTSDKQVAMLPLGAEAPQWEVIPGEDTAQLFVNGHGISPLGDSHVGAVPVPAYLWYMKKFPYEQEAYIIHMHRPGTEIITWCPPEFFGKENALVELIEGKEYPFSFRLVSQN